MEGSSSSWASSSSSWASSSKPWGEVIGFTLLVNLLTLSGVVFLVSPSIRKSLRHPVVHALSPAADKEIHAHQDEHFVEEDVQPKKELAQRNEKEHSKMLDIFIVTITRLILQLETFLSKLDRVYLTSFSSKSNFRNFLRQTHI